MIIEITYVDVVEERLLQIVHMEEECFVVGFHNKVEKQRKKSWHDQQIKRKHFEVGGIVLMYDIKLFKQHGKLKTHWLGPYIVIHITNGGAMQLKNIDGTLVRGLINGSRLKSYHDSRD